MCSVAGERLADAAHEISDMNLSPDKADSNPHRKEHEMMDLETLKQHREEMIREVEQDRLAKSLRIGRRRRGSRRVSDLVWELKRIAGRLRKAF